MLNETMFEVAEADAVRIKKLAESIVLSEAEIERMQKSVTASRQVLITLMQQAGLDSVKLESGLSPKLETKQRISRRKEVADDAVFTWLAENGMGDIVRPSVHAGTLQNTLQQHTAQGGAVPEEMFSTFEQTTIRFNGRSKFLSKEA